MDLGATMPAVRGQLLGVADPSYDEVLNLTDTGDVESDLRDFARHQLRAVMKPRLLQLRRLSRVFYERGPGRDRRAGDDTRVARHAWRAGTRLRTWRRPTSTGL